MMDAIEIIYRPQRLGKSQAQIARELGVSGGVVNNVIHDRITAYEIARHIAGLLECKVDEIWPGRYSFKPRGPSSHRTKIKAESITGEKT
ncbi:helix-turn-helix domain-containing protein [Methylomonas fluvii]|uniref:Helix-turn-helix domain-containing protein n=1 Tax=Methylomonas fluvii TaxID=1854564 RepID=A0ABR9DA08_9GAMM|nr:helix-turn-helix domain-containing protein [Methylomonas fluvii]MBD9359661.1 helix-turn-helix domain-containing protein [Methylomonas fluvii]